MNRGLVFLAGLGIATIYLGSRGFTRQGLPLSEKKSITGLWGRAVGAIVMLLGLGMIAFVISTLLTR